MFDRTNRFLIIAGFLLSVSQLAFASEPNDSMKQGNQFYQDKQYEKAVESYQRIVNMGYAGTSLYYNLGNSYYRNGKIGYAILYYEKALELSPGDDDVTHNLAIANTKTVDKIDTLPRFFLFQWWESILALFSTTGWTYTVYLFYLLLLASIGLYFFARSLRIQRYSVFSGLISALLLIITATIWIVSLNRELTIKNAIVLEPTIAVKLAPDSTSNDAFVIHEGLKVRELDQVENWVKIRLQDGKEGWIQQNEIGTI
jgi:tetratricopeptide (TPR) repeat protein